MDSVNIIGKFAENDTMRAASFACGAHAAICTIEGRSKPQQARITVIVEEDKTIGVALIPSVERHGALVTPRLRREEEPLWDMEISLSRSRKVEIPRETEEPSDDWRSEQEKHFNPPEAEYEVQTEVNVSVVRTETLTDFIYRKTLDGWKVESIELVPAEHKPVADAVTLDGKFGTD